MFDEIEHVILPGGASLIHKQGELSQPDDSEFEREVFAASAVRKIRNTPWSLRMPYSADGVWYFDILCEKSLEPEFPVFSSLLCLNKSLSNEFWKVAMLINLRQVAMPDTVPWLATMVHENANNLPAGIYTEGEELSMRVAWSIIRRVQP